jgi:hypothetical protein
MQDGHEDGGIPAEAEAESPGFREETICGCSLLYAAEGECGIPIDGMLKVAGRRSGGCVMDTDIARIHGAVVVLGKPGDLARLREAPETIAKGEALAARLSLAVGPHLAGPLSAEARHWAVFGEQGLSSQALFRVLTGVSVPGAGFGISHPRDPADLRRCLLLIEQVPECRGRLAAIADISPAWAALAAVWDRLAATLSEEAPEWRGCHWKAPRTFALMSSALEGN